MENIEDKLSENQVLARVLAKSLRAMEFIASHRQETNVPRIADNLMHTYAENLTGAAALFYAQGYITEKQNLQVWRIAEKIWKKYQTEKNRKIA